MKHTIGTYITHADESRMVFTHINISEKGWHTHTHNSGKWVKERRLTSKTSFVCLSVFMSVYAIHKI